MRETRAWTQEHLAQVAGIEPRTVQRVEKDRTKNPETLQNIAAAFNIDVSRLRSKWMIPESRLVGTYFADNQETFVNIEEGHRWHAYSRAIVATLTEEDRKEANELLDQIFADRELIEPDERELWKGYIEQIEEPLAALFAMKLAIFIVDERRDLLLPKSAFVAPGKPYIDDWRVQYFLVVPLHGCFRTNPSGPLHRFNEDCRGAGDAVFDALKRNAGLHVCANALVAITEDIGWCDVCFPLNADGSRLNLDYVEQVTGLRRDQWYDFLEGLTGDHYLQGLS